MQYKNDRIVGDGELEQFRLIFSRLSLYQISQRVNSRESLFVHSVNEFFPSAINIFLLLLTSAQKLGTSGNR